MLSLSSAYFWPSLAAELVRLFETRIDNAVLFTKVANSFSSPSVNIEYMRHHFCHPQSSPEELLSSV